MQAARIQTSGPSDRPSDRPSDLGYTLGAHTEFARGIDLMA